MHIQTRLLLLAGDLFTLTLNNYGHVALQLRILRDLGVNSGSLYLFLHFYLILKPALVTSFYTALLNTLLDNLIEHLAEAQHD